MDEENRSAMMHGVVIEFRASFAALHDEGFASEGQTSNRSLAFDIVS
jgi:hypothetical protein